MPLVFPLLVLALATLGLVRLWEPFLSWYYQWAWWSYVFAADALNKRLSGRSLLRDTPRQFAFLALASIVYWTFFEALNLRLGNWYYVMDHPARAARWLGGAVAFATVLPGILETEALIANLGLLRRVSVPRLRIGVSGERVFVGIGLAGAALPMLWPERFFWMVWAIAFFLLEPWNRRQAKWSVLRDLEAGDAAGTVRALLAGLGCGFLWETWNYWARTKWIYTVPGFEELKLFEMPLLGFLGFPPFALGSLVFASALLELRRRASRLPPGRLRALRLTGWGAAALSTLVVFDAADRISVDSTYVPVAELRTLPEDDRRALAGAGLASTERLLRALDDENGLRQYAETTHLSRERLLAAREHVALVMHHGLGESRALELARLGVTTRADLSQFTPESLASLMAAGSRGPARFLGRRVRVWLHGSGLEGSARTGSLHPRLSMRSCDPMLRLGQPVRG